MGAGQQDGGACLNYTPALPRDKESTLSAGKNGSLANPGSGRFGLV
jgi:hypothetical protein